VRREGREGLEQRLQGATLLSDYLFERLTEGLNLASTEGRAALDAAARPLLSTVPAGTFRTLLEERLAVQTGLRHRHLSAPAVQRRSPPRRDDGSPLTNAGRAVALLLDNPALGKQVLAEGDNWRQFKDGDTTLLAEVVDVLAAYPMIAASALRERWRDGPRGPEIVRLSAPGRIAHIPADGREAELVDAIRALNRDAERAHRQALLRAGSIQALTEEARSRLRRSSSR
jgi:DNA primase